MNILLIGGGGREHAFAWKLRQSPKCGELYIAPGNPGMALLGTNTGVAVDNFEMLAQLIRQHRLQMVVIGPEVPLVQGLRDYLISQEEFKDLIIIGPDKKGAQLEGSKDFSKKFMQKYGIPTASYRTFTIHTLQEGLEYISTHPLPIVLKADGLAAGKGVVIATTHSEAKSVLEEMIVGRKFGDSSNSVVIEQFLQGIELSVFVLTDGKSYVVLPEAKDYKRIGEKDTGPNTGGMGAVSPVPFATPSFMQKVTEKIILPTLAGLQQEGIVYQGFIFLGLIKCGEEPYVIEYNARMGDPETEAVLPRLENDFVELLEAVGSQSLHKHSIRTDPRTATTVVLVSGGYPDEYEKGFEITGVDTISNAHIFHAGTSLKEGKLINTGGRVLAITAMGKNIPEALAFCNQAAEAIHWQGKNYRRDIGLDLL